MDDEQVHQPSGLVRPRGRRTPLLRVQQVQLVREGTASFALRQVTSSHDVYAAFRDECEHADREFVWAVLLNNQNRVIGVEEISRGSLTAALLHPREVFKAALLANAANVILVHVHPGGSATPSAEDLAITKRLREVGELMGVPLLDHLVIGHGRYTSLRDDGYL